MASEMPMHQPVIGLTIAAYRAGKTMLTRSTAKLIAPISDTPPTNSTNGVNANDTMNQCTVRQTGSRSPHMRLWFKTKMTVDTAAGTLKIPTAIPKSGDSRTAAMMKPTSAVHSISAETLNVHRGVGPNAVFDRVGSMIARPKLLAGAIASQATRLTWPLTITLTLGSPDANPWYGPGCA